MQFEAELKNLSQIRRFVADSAAALGADSQAISDMMVAAEEAAANIVIHGYQGKSGFLEVEVTRKGEHLEICFRDQAPPFDPTSAPPPDLTLPLEQRPYGGMGIHLIRQVMDHVAHRTTPQGGNELTLVKRLNTTRRNTDAHYNH